MHLVKLQTLVVLLHLHSEMSQNSERLSWTFEEVDAKLKNIMVNICHNMDDAAKRFGMGGNYFPGATHPVFESWLLLRPRHGTIFS